MGRKRTKRAHSIHSLFSLLSRAIAIDTKQMQMQIVNQPASSNLVPLFSDDDQCVSVHA